MNRKVPTAKGSEKSGKGPIKIPAREKARRNTAHEIRTVIGYSTMTWE